MNQRTTSIDDPDLSDLLDGINSGRVALPNFQRDFDWTDSDVRALLATVLNGWPMGSLLLIEGNPESQDFYDPRPFEFAPPLNGIPDTIVLDGQQRLTSLYTALYDCSDSVHAVSLDGKLEWGNIDSVDDSIRTFKRPIWDAHYPNAASQIKAELMPVSVLRSSSRFFDWRDSASAGSQKIMDDLTKIYRDHLAGLYRYRMPALRISKDTHPAAVARIFERVNKTGQQLGAFDLMVAKSFTPRFNLRVAWEVALERFPSLKAFYGSDGLAPLQVIALRVLDDVRTSSVLKLTPSTIHDYWSQAVQSLNDAVRFSMEHLGVLSREWLPYNSLMVVLAAHSWSHPFDKDGVLRVKRWFWQSCLTSRYAVGSNSVAVADYRRLRESHYAEPVALHLDWAIFRDATKQSAGAIHRAWLCTLAASLSEWKDEVDQVVPIPRSIVPRDVRNNGEVSPHLLTLGFVLTSEDQGILGKQFVKEGEVEGVLPFANDSERRVFMRERLQRAAAFVAEECTQSVSVIDDTDQELKGRGD